MVASASIPMPTTDVQAQNTNRWQSSACSTIRLAKTDRRSPERREAVFLSVPEKERYLKKRMTKYNFILASKSPRRKELLRNIGINAEVVTSDVDESKLRDLPPEKMVTELAMMKAADVARSFRGNTIVIGADTAVVLEGKIFGKPKSMDEAKEMLRLLSGKTHEVYTGYCVFDCSDASAVSKYEVTKVTFRALSEEEINGYVKTREPMDKAGAYGIQKKGSVFIRKIDGDYFNVVGLPVCALAVLLKEEFQIDVI